MYLVKDKAYNERDIMVGIFTSKRKALIGIIEYLIADLNTSTLKYEDYIDDCIISNEFFIYEIKVNYYFHMENFMIETDLGISDEQFRKKMKNKQLLRHLKIEELTS